MITYFGGAFGFKILLRLHGSAVFKSLTPALISSVIYLLLNYYFDLDNDEERIFDHPYTVGALVVSFTFLLAFRANFAYLRYWEAYTAIHLMHSKWLDFATEVAAFHYQADKYNELKPPAFGKYPNITSVCRQRHRIEEPSLQELQSVIDKCEGECNHHTHYETSLRSRFQSLFNSSKSSRKKKRQEKIKNKRRRKSQNNNNNSRNNNITKEHIHSIDSGRNENFNNPTTTTTTTTQSSRSDDNVVKEQQQRKSVMFHDQIDVNGIPYTTFQKATRKTLELGGLDPDHHSPPLFLEEAAHLLSLLSAVALSTLRNDLDEAESPLIEFTPGERWPHVDPDSYSADIRKGWSKSGKPYMTILRFLCGLSRTDGSRTLYNAARPFRVIGNVSDSEITLIQAARGPFAKVALCTMWLQEFLSREYLNGSTGKVAPPIISRLYQFTSDGMTGYNQARKIAYIPFPFPHAQITCLFVLVIIGLIPVLMLSYLNNIIFGFFLNLITAMCFCGLHEVARELENPFKNVPNDVPLNNFQAQFNEGLMTMFFGYHPDLYWEANTTTTKTTEDEETKMEEVAPALTTTTTTTTDENSSVVLA